MEPLLHPEAVFHGALQARLIEEVEGQLFAGEHAQRRLLCVSHHFRSLRDREVRLLVDRRQHHADHPLESAQVASFFRFRSRVGTFRSKSLGIFHGARCVATSTL